MSSVEEIDYEGLSHDSVAINMLAGALAGISEHAVMYPVDSIKVRLAPISRLGERTLIRLDPPTD